MKQRSTWGSSLGFLMAAVGAAVGLGNLWAFPHKLATTGGGAFLVVYGVLTVLVGVPVLMGEIAVGRRTGRGPVEAFRAMHPDWAWVGWAGVLAGGIVLAYYCVLGGVCIRYVLLFAGEVLGAPATGNGFYRLMTGQTRELVLYALLFAGITGGVVLGGVQRGIERFSLVAMPLLCGMLLLLAGYVALQPGAERGYALLFRPDWQYLRSHFMTVLVTAAGQMFFSLSIAMGTMVVYGSYLDRRERIFRDAAVIGAADTLIALLASCVLIPAGFAFAEDGAEMSGCGLLFETMYQVFHRWGGRLGGSLGMLFFGAVFLAALTSGVSLLEAVVSAARDRGEKTGGAGREKGRVMGCALLAFLLCIPVAWDGLGNLPWRTPLALLRQWLPGLPEQGWNGSFLGLYTFLSEGILMPLGALGMCLLLGYRCGTEPIARECGVRPWILGICYRVLGPAVILLVLYGQIRTFLV